MKFPPLKKLVMVEWLDANGGDDGWRDVADVDCELAVVKTVGWFVKREKAAIAVAASYACHPARDRMNVIDVCVIPISTIRKIKVLKC